ncbi:MAG: hypothetical protein K0S24_456 [Sphingobacterium sp.]|nr:hypothetical protein [Sphingobacterium sp.]
MVLLLIASSCSKDSESMPVENKTDGITFKALGAEFAQSPVTKAQNNRTSSPIIAVEEIQSGPFTITAELSEDLSTTSQPSLKAGTNVKAAVPFATEVKYRVVAYQLDGTYIDQAIGSSAQPNAVMFSGQLTAGQTYKFVIYSLGSATDAPPAAPTSNINAAGDLSKALTLTFDSFEEQGADFMYALVEKEIEATGQPTALAATLQHKFSKVSIQLHTADATGTFGTSNYVKGGYLSETPVNAEVSNAGGLNKKSSIDLSTGAVIGGEAATPFRVLGINATAKSYILNTAATTGTTSFAVAIDAGSIKIGNDVNTRVTPFEFTASALEPGKAYTLRIRLNSDRYVNAAGATRTANQPDARYAVIGGYRWDRYNLGVANVNPATNNPDAVPSVQALYGNYYQWGRQVPVANAYSGDGAIAGWNTTPAADGSWNNGTAAAPVKAAVDPCGLGDRIPSQAEYTRLGNSTRHTSIGNWTAFNGNATVGLSDFTAAHIMTSRKSSDVKLSFPANGHRSPTTGAQLVRQSSAIYWLNTAFGGNDYALHGRGFVNGSWDTSNYLKNAGYPVRCIQDK